MMRLPASYRDPKIFNNKYIVKQQISAGSFGVVYLAFDKYSREELAVKVEREENEDVSTLDREITILKRLDGIQGVPKLFWHGLEQDYNVIVIQLLGKDLSVYMKQFKKFSLKSVLQLSISLMKTLQQVHEKGVIHRDFKPENILTGPGLDNGQIYLVDYGVSKVYIDSQGRHMRISPLLVRLGTHQLQRIKVMSLGGRMISNRYFLYQSISQEGIDNNTFRKLPWQNLQNIGDRDRTEVVGEVKQSTDINELCRDCPHEFAEILQYLHTLEFKSEPDYKYIQSLLSRAVNNNHLLFDNVYEWTEKPKESRINNQLIWAVQDEKKGQSTQNLLKPPDPQQKISSQSPLRGEQKHMTNTSIQGSLSSMIIKYVPSQIDNCSQKKDNKSKKSKKSKQSRKSRKSRKSSKYSKKKNQMPLSDVQVIDLVNQREFNRHKTIDSTWGFQKYMEEYSDDSQKLGDKYKKLQNDPLKFKIKRRTEKKKFLIK